MSNKIYYKIPLESAKERACKIVNNKEGSGKLKKDFHRTTSGSPCDFYQVRKTKYSKLETLERDLQAAKIPYSKKTTATHVILANWGVS